MVDSNDLPWLLATRCAPGIADALPVALCISNLVQAPQRSGESCPDVSKLRISSQQSPEQRQKSKNTSEPMYELQQQLLHSVLGMRSDRAAADERQRSVGAFCVN